MVRQKSCNFLNKKVKKLKLINEKALLFKLFSLKRRAHWFCITSWLVIFYTISVFLSGRDKAIMHKWMIC